MGDWSIATYAELCAYHNWYSEQFKKYRRDSDFNVLMNIEKEMRKREACETFGKTIH